MSTYKQKLNSYFASASYFTLFLLLLLMTYSTCFISQPRAPYCATTSPTGILVPLYSYPTDDTWEMMIKLKKTYPLVPTVAIINPSDGPGPSKDPH